MAEPIGSDLAQRTRVSILDKNTNLSVVTKKINTRNTSYEGKPRKLPMEK
jgi:hypothetical protein